MTYTGGTTVLTSTIGSPPVPTTTTTYFAYSSQTTYYGGGGKSLLNDGGPIVSWTINSSGPVNAKITYIGTGTRPKKVILTVYCKAAYFGPTGSAANGLDNPLIQDDTWWKSEGTKYIVLVFPPTGDLNYSLTPTASASTATTDMCGTRIDFKVTPSAVRINLLGVLNPATDKRLLIGQPLKGTLDFGSNFSPGNNPVTYTWTLSGGHPFLNYLPTPSQAVYIPFVSSPTSNSVLQIFFAEPANFVTVTCAVSIPGLSLAFTTNVNVIPEKPDILDGQIDIGEFQYLPNATNPQDFKLYGAQITGVSYIVGMAEVYWVSTQQRYWQGPMKGQYCWTQLLDPYSQTNTNGGGWLYTLPGPGGTFLDRDHPYPQCGWFTANGQQPLDEQHTQFFRDSPGFENISVIPTAVEVDSSYGMKYHDYFRLFVMYDPPGLATAQVPLRMRSWTALGEFMWTRASGWGVASDDSDIGTTMDFPYHPVWTQKWP